MCVGSACTNTACTVIGNECDTNSECCSGICEIEEDPGGSKNNPIYTGYCVAGSAGGSVSCPATFKISGATFSSDVCIENCVDHLDHQSYRMENGVKVETSSGDNTFSGVCLAIKGNVYDDEHGTTASDVCITGNTAVRKYIVDGCSWCMDEIKSKDYACPFGCSEGACRTSSSCQGEAGTCSANGDCCTGMYCTTAKKCCAVGYKYDSFTKQCVEGAHCNEPTNLCPYKPSDAAFWDNPNDVRLCLAYGAVKPNTYEACCLTGNYGDPALKEYEPITTY